jgi:hypothetical protein
MIENSMFEEEPDVVDLAKDSAAFPVTRRSRSLEAMNSGCTSAAGLGSQGTHSCVSV